MVSEIGNFWVTFDLVTLALIVTHSIFKNSDEKKEKEEESQKSKEENSKKIPRGKGEKQSK